jgi:hypothetical protein
MVANLDRSEGVSDRIRQALDWPLIQYTTECH